MEQQMAILRSLLARLDIKEAEDDDETESGYAGEFMRLKKQSTKYRTDKTYPSKAAEKQDNVKKNRYKDIVPFDHSRVKLSLNSSKNDSDYINASFIKGVSGNRAYIATQGPLPHTVLDFWKMIWEYNIEVIVMACREFEMGRKKCERYWPATAKEPFVCESFTVYNESEESKGDYITRTLRVTNCNRTRALLQLHYMNWPDHGVPDSIPPILEMLQEMRSYQAHEELPICIHCSAGCGRTGALCAIDYTWNLIRRQMIRESFSIFDLVQTMRTQRPSVVQTKEQYELVYRTIKFLFKRYLQSMDTPACLKEESVVSVPSPAERDSGDSDLIEEFQPKVEPETLPKFYPGLEQRDMEHPTVHPALTVPSAPRVDSNLGAWYDIGPQLETTRPFFSDVQSALRARDMDRQRQYVQPSASQDHEGWPSPSSDPSRASLCLGSEFSHRAPEMVTILEKREEPLPLNSLVAPVISICLTVEDPYFQPESPALSPTTVEVPRGSPEGWVPLNRNMENPCVSRPSLTLNNQTLELQDTPDDGSPDPVMPSSGDNVPPPLPCRTPESFQLATEAESHGFMRLEVIIPTNAAAVALRELGASPVGSSPPSPVPSLPERTPESFELAVHEEAPVGHVILEKPLDRLGTSSEWSGNSGMTSPKTSNKLWSRSKSLKVKMNLSASETPVFPAAHVTDLAPPPPPSHALTPPLSPQACDSLTPPLPKRTPESFILVSKDVHQNSAPCLQIPETTEVPQRIGTSSEWAGNPQPKSFLDSVMNRSKSVRTKSARQELLAVAIDVAPPPMAVAGGGSAGGQPLADNRVSPGTALPKSDMNGGKGMSRTRSLRFFRPKSRPKTAPPPPPTKPGPSASYAASLSLFKFGFGNRFGKPKGPRSHPEGWV